MITRRGLIRSFSLAAVAVAGGAAVAGCNSDGSGGASGRTSGTDLVPVAAEVPRAAGDPTLVPAQVQALHGTGGAVWNAVLSEHEGNVTVSPYSLGAAFALALNGAAGVTQREMRGLYGGAPVTEINSAWNALTASLEAFGSDDVSVEVANQLFGQRDLTWNQPFLDALAANYGAGLETLDYTSDPDAARDLINTWVEAKTHDKIVDLLGSGTITSQTRLTLVNALYFKARWANDFDTAATSDEPFHLDDGRTVTVPMMHGSTRNDLVRQGEGWTSVRLDYDTDTAPGLAMTIILPDAGQADDVVEAVAAGNLADYLPASDDYAMVNLALPKWTTRTSADLIEPLRALGVTRAFNANADFSPMTADQPLTITDVVQQVFVAVDEAGTEAAAATAVTGAASAPGSDDTVDLTVDRTFLYVIHDAQYGTPLFLGLIRNPLAG